MSVSVVVGPATTLVALSFFASDNVSSWADFSFGVLATWVTIGLGSIRRNTQICVLFPQYDLAQIGKALNHVVWSEWKPQ